jgi:putative SOS response-associated peptidase YedK
MDGRAPRRVTNVREDKILTSKFWRGSFDARRCLVPASSFCEPNSKVKPATWHWFALAGDEPRRRMPSTVAALMRVQSAQEAAQRPPGVLPYPVADASGFSLMSGRICSRRRLA